MGYERNFGNVTFNVIQNPPNYATVSLHRADRHPLHADLHGHRGAARRHREQGAAASSSCARVDPNIVNAWAHFWSVSLQREIFANTTASIEYTGSKGVDLYSISNINRTGFGAYYLGDSSLSTSGRTSSTAASTSARNDGSSLYNGVTFGLDWRKLGDTGLQFTARYTLGWAKDDLSNTFSEGGNNGIANGLGFLDPLNPDLDYGYAEFDVRHRFVGSAHLGAPTGEELDGLREGSPQRLAVSLLVQRPERGAVLDRRLHERRRLLLRPDGGRGSAQRLHREGAVGRGEHVGLPRHQQPGPRAFGTIASALTGDNEVWADADTSKMSKRDAFRGPGTWNIDAGLYKRFRFTDRFAMQLRLEVYNLFNHANLYLNGAEADISTTDMITAYKDGARRLQIAAKFEF